MNKIAVLTVAAAVGLCVNAGIASAAGSASDAKSFDHSSQILAANESGAADAHAKLAAQCKKLANEGKKMTKECQQMLEKQKSGTQADKSKMKYE